MISRTSLLIFLSFAFVNLQAQRTAASLQARPLLTSSIGSTVAGTIQVSGNLQLPANSIQLQVWQVTYQTNSKDPNTSDIVFQQRINANVSFQPNGSNTGYRITGLPSYRNLAVVLFSDPIPNVNGVKVQGFPNDGRGASSGHKYVSDAGSRLVRDRFVRVGQQGVIYGIYSLVPGQTNPSAVNFKVTSALARGGCSNCFDISDLDPSQLVNDIGNAITSVINGVTYVFDQVVDGVANVATLAVNDVEQGIVSVAGYVINTTGLIFYSVGGTLVNLIVYGNAPRMRSLTDNEYNWANSLVFNGQLPPKSSIVVFNFMNPDHRRCYTFPSLDGSQEYMNMGDAFDNLLGYTNSAYVHPSEVFVHELTHTWQIAHYGAINMVKKYFADGGTGQTYDINCQTGPTASYNLEQMAQMTNAVFAEIYYPANLFPQYSSSTPCSWCLGWVQSTIRNAPFDTAAIYAGIAMRLYGGGLQQFLGDVSQGIAVASPGNATDKGGYFMAGSQNNGMLYFWSRMHSPLANWGALRQKYLTTGAERGPLGWPAFMPGIGLRNNGYFQQFERGWIYSTPQFGSFVITEPIFDTWAKQSYEKGALGYPISDYIPDNTSSNTGNVQTQVVSASGSQKFEHGIITFTSRLGQVTTQVIMSNQMIKNKLANNATGGSATQTTTQPPPGATKTLKPGEKNSLNPQPLPPMPANRPNQ